MRLRFRSKLEETVYPAILKHMLLPVGETLRGTSVLCRLRQLEQSQWESSERLRELQKEKLRRLVHHAYEHVPYYRRVFEERGMRPEDIATPEDLSKLPVLTKEETRRQFRDQISADNCKGNDYLRLHSSGSTGEPYHFYLSKAGHDARLAAMFRYWRAAGYDFGQPWVRIRVSLDISLADRVYHRLMRCAYLRYMAASERVLLEQLEKIRRVRPTVVRGYAPALFMLAKTARDHDMNDFGVRSMISTGSILFPHFRQLIESQFDCPVYDVYGGEGMIIAGQFECGSYHIHAEGVVVEFLKPGGDAARPGELGSIVLTNLNNLAMPFIRYQIGDLGVPSKAGCSCGRGLPVMESIQGRDTDIVVTPDGGYLIVHFFTRVFNSANVDQFQVIQHAPDRIEIKIVRNELFTRADVDYILRSIRSAGGDELKVDLRYVESIPLTRSGKRRFVISEVGQGHFRSGMGRAASESHRGRVLTREFSNS
ncbi:phenylacetate--CoA ligase family protein [Chloroflexota bacterium]